MSKNKSCNVDLEDTLLTVRQVAERDNTSEKTVRRAIDAGLLDALRVGPGGRLVRITRAAHAAYRARLQWGRISKKV